MQSFLFKQLSKNKNVLRLALKVSPLKFLLKPVMTTCFNINNVN